ncbi:hypothetical protein TNCT_523391 [Trichonephila clavata]|uniref:Uncharacterized protein n=1 Tax=Trichonephila clavata TaxID=2740835 RepID=A0A8X6K785_TRICU|nr:hypothetical protein TNCT_523391 [Trichonephila clavata]
MFGGSYGVELCATKSHWGFPLIVLRNRYNVWQYDGEFKIPRAQSPPCQITMSFLTFSAEGATLAFFRCGDEVCTPSINVLFVSGLK